MKKVLFLFAILAGYMSFYSTETHAKSIPSKALTSAKIYINPGHGCWCSECRHMGTVKHGFNAADTSGFFESNTNLWKAFGMRDKLIEYGVPYNTSIGANDLRQPNLVMSRVKCGGVHNGLYDRALSEIAAECENWGADVMISIHSNAATEGTNANYPLLLYRGNTGSNQNGGSQAIASSCWGYLWENSHMMWTYYSATNKNIQGDWTFQPTWGTQGYGVLRHSVPGFLAEGYFHTYQPARHRAMNRDAGRIEGIAYAKGFRDYFGGGKAVSTGDIYGVLRDAERTFTHTYYNGNQNTDDKYKPINGATVTLKKPDGTVVKTYMTDDEYNGVFVFNKVEPGTYNIVCSHPDYADVTTSVTVQADKVVYPSVKISEGEQIPVQGHYAYDLSMTQNGDDYTLKFKSTGDVENGSVVLTNTATATKQVIKIGKVTKGENSYSFNANDLGENSTFTWAISLDNLKSSAVQLIKEDNSITYSHSSGNMARIGLAIDKDTESANFGKIYTLTSFSQGLQTFNQDLSKNGSKVKIGTFGQDTDASTSTNKYVRSNRITINSGKVYIANYANQNYGVWVHTPGTTTSSQIIGTNYDRAVGFKGTGSNRQMYVMHEKTDNSNLGLRYYNIGTSDTWAAGSNSPSGSLSSTVLANGDGDIIVTSKGIFASQWRAGTNTSDAPAFVFYNNSNSIAFNSSTIGTLSGTHKGGIAINNNLSTFAIVESPTNTGDDVVVEIYSVTWNGETPSFGLQYSIPLSSTKQIDQMAFDQADNLYIASQQKGLLVYTIKQPTRQTVTPAKASLKIQGKALPAVKGHYAYDLKMTQSGDNYTLKFKSTGKVDNASVLFINKADNDTVTLKLGAIVEGENTVTLNAADFGKNADYTWAVAIDNPESPSNELVYSDNSITYNHSSGYMARIGMAINRDTETDKFGRIFTITSFGQGIQEFDQMYGKIGDRKLKDAFGIDKDESSSNRFIRSNRLAVSDNKIYIANYASLRPGVHIYNSHNGGDATILNGMYERAVGFSGSGANRKMYVYNDASLRRYDIGAGDTWTGNTNAPSATYTTNMINGDGDILVTDNGVIIAQHRYRGNNTSDVPVFKFVDFDGNIVFNSSILTELTGSQNGAMSISSDLSTFAIVDGYAEGSAADIEVDIFDVTWAGSTPSFSYRTSIPLVGTKQVDQMTFDYAGNLVVASQQKGLLVYAVKNPARTTVTPAKSTLVIAGKYIPGTEGHFAYDLEMEETSEGYTLKFKSTGDVDNAKLVLTEVGDAKEVNTTEQEIGAVTKGENSIELITESLPYGTQTWAVILENAASEGAEVIKSDASVTHAVESKNNASGGVTIDKDSESDNFGTIYTATGWYQGIQVFTADMEKVGEKIFADKFVNGEYSPYRIKANGGKLYIPSWYDGNAGVWVYDPSAETPELVNVFDGTVNDKGQIINNEVIVGANVTSVTFAGEGAARKMYAFTEDATTGFDANSILRYDLGAADTWATAPSGAFTTVSGTKYLTSVDVELLATENGIICAQKSENSNTAEKPAFVVVDFDGNVVYNSSALTDLNGSMGAAVALYGNIFAIVNADGNIEIYKVAWNENTPSFSDRYVIKLNNTKQITQMDFDTAGNLYAFSVEEGLLKIAVKNEARSTRTNAKAELQLVNSILTAVESIEVEAPAEYYNLQGIKVDKPENGIFIKKQGSKASKVIL